MSVIIVYDVQFTIARTRAERPDACLQVTVDDTTVHDTRCACSSVHTSAHTHHTRAEEHIDAHTTYEHTRLRYIRWDLLNQQQRHNPRPVLFSHAQCTGEPGSVQV